MDVGSAKVDESVCSRVPHHLLDVASIREQFSAGDYYKLAMLAIKVGRAARAKCLSISHSFPPILNSITAYPCLF